MGRPLLALSGARLLYGFRDPQWSRLSLSYDDAMPDPKNRREIATHSKRIMNMIERLGTLSHATGKIIRRDDLSRGQLRQYGIAEDEHFAVLHTGARIVWSRWAHFLKLASRLLQDTKLKVALFTDNADLRNNLPPDLAGSDRFIILDKQLPFDDFDAFLSFCSVLRRKRFRAEAPRLNAWRPRCKHSLVSYQLERMGPGAHRRHCQSKGALRRLPYLSRP